MARDIFTDQKLLATLQEIKPSEEDRYSDIPGWEGEYLADSPDAILLYMPEGKGRGGKEVWMPKSQLRIAEDKQSIYASNWVISVKGL